MPEISIRWLAVPLIAGFLLGVGAFVYNATVSAAPAQGLAEVAAAASDGGIIHTRDEVYRRHGPAADRILETPSVGVLPEAHSVDVWVLFDSDGRFVATTSAVRDASGRLVQRGIAREGQYLVQNLLTGVDVENDFVLAPSRPSVDQYVQEVSAATAADIQTRLSTEGWTREVDDGGFVRLTKLEPVGSQAENGWNVPYVADLAVQVIELEQVFTEDLDFVSESRTARLSSGDEVVIESRTAETVEIVDSGMWDDIVSSLFPDG